MKATFAAQYLLIIFSLTLSSCINKNQPAKTSNGQVNMGPVIIELPSKYNFFRAKGIETNVGYIVDDKNDTFQVEYGNLKFIFRLYDYPPVVFPTNMKGHFPKNEGATPGDDQVVYTNTPEEDNAEGVFLKNYYFYDTINGLHAKIVHPKKVGHGITGVLFPELPENMGLSIYARDLDSAEHYNALKMYYNIHLNRDLK